MGNNENHIEQINDLHNLINILHGNWIVLDKNFDVLIHNKKALNFFECEKTGELTLSYIFNSDSTAIEDFKTVLSDAFSHGEGTSKFVRVDKFGIKINICAYISYYKGFLLVNFKDVSKNELEPNKSTESYKMLKAIVNATPLALNLWDENMNNIFCNEQVLNLFSMDSQKEYLENFYKFSPEYQPCGELSLNMIDSHMKTVLEKKIHKFKWMHLNNKGEELPCEITLVHVKINEDEDNVVGFVRDLRDEFSMKDEHEDYYFLDRIPEKTFLREVAKISDDIFFAIDKRTSSVHYLDSANTGEVRGFSTIVYSDKSVHPDDVSLFREMIACMDKGISKPFEIRYLQKDGSYIYYHIVYRCILDESNSPIIVIGKGVDISEQKTLERLSKYDSLTECYNRENLQTIIEEKTNKYNDFAILIIDINSFKDFNDSYGYYHGDEVLRQIAKRLKKWVRETDVVGRNGGDEFVVYVAMTKENLDQRLDDLLNELNKVYNVLDEEYVIDVRVGVFRCDSCGMPYEEILKKSNEALLLAKTHEKSSWAYYDSVQNMNKSLNKSYKPDRISGINMDFTITSTIFNILYDGNSDQNAINSALKYLAQSYKVNKCFIAESFDKGETFKATYEWCDNNAVSYLLNGVIDIAFIKDLVSSVDERGIFSCHDLNELDFNKDFKQFLFNCGTKAFIHSQVEKDGYVDFYLGMEDCKNTKNWTETECNTIHYISRILSIILQEKYLNKRVEILNEYSKISAFVSDNTDNFVYIVDIDTYDIIHMNKRALEMYSITDENQWKNKKCYEVLHNKIEPCEFCTNRYVKSDDFYEWKYYNPRFNKTYLFRDKLVPLNGKLVKLQIATDITRLVSLENEITDKLEEQSLLFNCIKMLHTTDTPDTSIEKILEEIGEFFGATRCIILKVNNEKTSASNTHEWVVENKYSRKSEMQEIDISLVQPVFDMFIKNSSNLAMNIRDIFKHNKDIVDLYKAINLKDLICAPISDSNGEFVGMFGVENPSINLSKHWLLSSISVFISDFLEKNNFLNTLNSLSYYDILTGIKNRHSYTKAIKEIEEDKITSLGVAYVDIIKLSKINEEKGFAYGDVVIKRLSFILHEVFGDDIFRVGGDEFVVLIKNVSEHNFEDMIKELKHLIYADDDLSATIGYTWNTGFDYCEVEGQKGYSAVLSRNLSNEINSGKYKVFLQSQIDLKTGNLGGAEALIRRVDAKGNIQAPISFVPFYEKEGMVSQIDFFVFETICKLLVDWKSRNIGQGLHISVNFSRATVMEKEMVNKLVNICNKYGVDKSSFIVEITETIAHEDDNVFYKIITSIRDAGFKVSLDDFGSGLSNLASLKISDFDEIKIDMSLTKDVHLDDKSKRLTKVALDLCNEFEQMISVAEGIETKEQCVIIKDLNCKKGQGYYFSRPISIDDFEKKYFI